MPETEVVVPAYTRIMAGHMKDAWLHVMGTVPPAIPSDSEFVNMASYILSNDDNIDDGYRAAYYRIKECVQKALDVRDPDGSSLREYNFTAPGFIKELQGYLLSAINPQ